MKFTGIKDIDRKILNQLDDKDLLSICSTNKSWKQFCDEDQTLWMNRVYNKFPYLSSDIINKNRKNIKHGQNIILILEKLIKTTTKTICMMPPKMVDWIWLW